MGTMKRDMSNLVTEFNDDVESYLGDITRVIDAACTTVVRATTGAGIVPFK
jgi:hypothetical protein